MNNITPQQLLKPLGRHCLRFGKTAKLVEMFSYSLTTFAGCRVKGFSFFTYNPAGLHKLNLSSFERKDQTSERHSHE